MDIKFNSEKFVSPESFIDVLKRSKLSERRPVSDRECIEGMLKGGNLTVTAWDGDLLVGISRSITDFHYACYLSDLAVDIAYQNKGIGRKLIALTQDKLGPLCNLILLSAPSAAEYYPRVGFSKHPSAWILNRKDSIIGG